MKNKLYYLIIGLGIGSISIFGISYEASMALSGFNIGGSTVTTDTTGGISMVGTHNIRLSGSGSTITISDPISLYITPITQVIWNSGNTQSYFDSFMQIQSSSSNVVQSSEPFGGNLTNVIINPVYNDQKGITSLSLFKNGINTTKTIIIPANSLSSININLNQNFNSNDILTWVITSKQPNQKIIMFNFREVINYAN